MRQEVEQTWPYARWATVGFLLQNLKKVRENIGALCSAIFMGWRNGRVTPEVGGTFRWRKDEQRRVAWINVLVVEFVEMIDELVKF